MHTPIGSIASQTASLTIAVFDASAATEWVPTKPAATKAQFTGHPAEVMRGLAKGEEAAAIDVGPSSGFAFEIEGTSGQLEIYRTDLGLVLVAPPRRWWLEHHADNAAAIDALFDELIHAGDDANEVGDLELTSGKLAAVYMWLKKVGVARDLAVPSGGIAGFGDGYGEGHGGAVVDLGVGTYRLARHEVAADFADGRALVAIFVTAT